jgi:hypothetical protein
MVLSPLAMHVACSASSGEAIISELREAGALEADNGSGSAEDGSVPSRDGGKPDVAPDARMDARVDVDAEAGAPPVIHINEIYADIDLFGDGAEFVELRAAPGTRVDDLALRIIDSTGNVDYVVSVANPGSQVGSTGFWVVGGGQTFRLGVQDRVDQIVALDNWGLETRRGAVQLVRGTELLDVVGWSDEPDAGAIPTPSSPPTATGEGSAARVPTIVKTPGQPAHSFGRRPNAADTNDNRADFCSMVASPGHAQLACD